MFFLTSWSAHGIGLPTGHGDVLYMRSRACQFFTRGIPWEISLPPTLYHAAVAAALVVPVEKRRQGRGHKNSHLDLCPGVFVHSCRNAAKFSVNIVEFANASRRCCDPSSVIQKL